MENVTFLSPPARELWKTYLFLDPPGAGTMENVLFLEPPGAGSIENVTILSSQRQKTLGNTIKRTGGYQRPVVFLEPEAFLRAARRGNDRKRNVSEPPRAGIMENVLFWEPQGAGIMENALFLEPPGAGIMENVTFFISQFQKIIRNYNKTDRWLPAPSGIP